jgi:hypothetical protein
MKRAERDVAAFVFWNNDLNAKLGLAPLAVAALL